MQLPWQHNWRSFSKASTQIVIVGVFGLLLWWLGNNLFNNLDNSGIPSDFDFLTQPTDFRITDNQGFEPSLPFWRAILIGVQNTVLVGVIGIIIASVLGVIVGIARLSSNWLVAKTSQVYVETFRNIPPLCIIIFFGIAIFTSGPLPIFSEAYIIKLPFVGENFLLLSNRQIGIPSFASSGNIALWWGLIIAGILIAAGIFIYRTLHNLKTGVSHHRWLWSLGFLIAFAVIAYFISSSPYHFSWPSISENGRKLVGGFGTSAGYLALTLALAIYTSSHIAEIIRGSIQSVPKGQGEAAYALSSFQKYRFVILPQAFRISVPPTINQYLNLMKNTSLGIAVAFPETANLINIAIGNGNPAPQSILVMMGVYLILSLIISVIGNSYNKLFLTGELKAVATTKTTAKASQT